MKLLIISPHIDLTAPGIVFQTIISELMKHHDISLLCTHFNPLPNIGEGSFKDVEIVKEIDFISPRYTVHVNRWFNSLFNISWTDWLLGFKKPKLEDNFDAVIGFGSSGNLGALKLMKKFPRSIVKGFYLVDACPTPSWWHPKMGQKGVAKFLKKYSEGLDWFASANSKMLDYEDKYISSSVRTRGVVHTPTTSHVQEENLSSSASERPTFIYTGSFYGARTPQFIIKGFELLLKQYPDALLYIIGCRQDISQYIPERLRNNISEIAFCKDLTPYYNKCTALLDIDAAVDGDVFLSSKVANYLPVPKPIICETGNNSPAREIFSNIPSIILCNHNEEEICEAMAQSIHYEGGFSDREKLIQRFKAKSSADAITNLIIKTITENEKHES